MTLNELKYIVAVAKEKHFGRAAAACFISQPTLSVAVKKLEEELGISLFERRKGQINVTPVGARVIDKAQHILEEADCIKLLAQRGQDQLNGAIRLGAIHTIGPYLFPHLVPKLRAIAPQMPLLVEENYSASLMEKLKGSDLDVIIVSLPFNDPIIRTMPLYEEPLVVLSYSSHPFKAQKEIRPEQLKDENLLMLGSGYRLREQVLEMCSECGINTESKSIEGSSLETIRYMVASELGITVLPYTAAQSEHLSTEFVQVHPFAGDVPKRTVALAWRKSFPRPLAINAVREAVMACELAGVTPMQ